MLHDRLELVGEWGGLVDNGRGKPLKNGWVGFVEQLQRLLYIPAVDVQHIVDWQFNHITRTIQLEILPAATSYKTPLVIITKGLSPFIVRPEAACSISELMLIVWIAVGVFHKAHSCSNFAKRLVGNSSSDFKSYASWCCCLRFSWS